MSSPYRPLTGLYRSFLNGLPLSNAQIKIKLSQNDFDLEAGYPVEEKTIVTTEDGYFPEGTTIWKTARGLAGAQVVFIEPDNFKWQAPVPEGDSPISVQELRANGTVITPPETVIALIHNTDLNQLRNVAFLNLADGDAVVWDEVSSKFVNRQISGGGSPGNQTANKVFASPDGVTGLPTFRALLANDIPNLAADKITSGTFGTTRFANNAVTFAKLQNISTAKILGRSTSATGSVEEISIGSGLSLAGGVLSATGGGGSIGGSGTAGAFPYFSANNTLADSPLRTAGGHLILNSNLDIESFNGLSTFISTAGFLFKANASQNTFQSNGGNDTNTLVIENTNTFANFPSQLLIKNAAYGTQGILRTTNGNGIGLHAPVNNINHGFTSLSFDMGAFSDINGSPLLRLSPVRAQQPGLLITAKDQHTANLIDLRDAQNNAIGGTSRNGGIIPALMADADADNGTIYFSTDGGRLAYKDAAGNIGNLG